MWFLSYLNPHKRRRTVGFNEYTSDVTYSCLWGQVAEKPPMNEMNLKLLIRIWII